ncbi:PAS domain S-box protein [Calothrix sp. 336/3]|uniref:PAS domain S-box protein n=1 Tax=Calothrix sp. 336/3 TaxID=1337936 RepID=UPI000624C942|nr:PAS domain S-box protein [Calothrix sp. 336/3]AKG20449.1 hypothetical protein IJ00_03170 [Calothrix sp. 336/3]
MKKISLLLAPYAVAVLAVGSALLLTLWLEPVLTPTLFQLFFAAVAVSAWYGGMGAGLLATLLSTVAISYFFLESISSPALLAVDNILRMGIYIFVTTLISSLNSKLRSAKQGLEISLQKLQASESKFRRLVDANIIGVIVADIRGGIQEANDAFLDMVGYSREDLAQGKVRWREMTPPEYVELSDRSIQELQYKGVCKPFAKEYIHKQGYRVPVLLGSALLDDSPEQVIGFVLDLTQLQQTETALHQSEKRFRQLVESNIFGVIFADFEGGIHYANDYFLQMVGYTRADLAAGKIRWDEMTPPEYYDLNQQAIQELRTLGYATPFEKEYFRQDGTRVPILLGIATIQNPGTRKPEVVAFYLDLSDRKQAEAALQQREEELRLITNALPVLIAYVDKEECYCFNNQAYEHWFGISPAEILGKSMREVIGECNYRLIQPYIQQVLSGEEVNYEIHIPCTQGNDNYIHGTYIPQFDLEGKVKGFVSLVSDITVRKLAEKEREELLAREQIARAEAEAVNRLKDEFLATISHELRTPLNAMTGWTQLLRSRKFDENITSKALETIDRNTKNLTSIIEDVLDVSAIIRGELRLNISPIDLIAVVMAAIDTIKPAANAKEISLTWDLDPTVGIVMGDSDRLQQIAWNLLSNAVKFTHSGGKVNISLKRQDSWVEIRVRDTGEGIAADFLPYVFERFRQADGSRTRSHGGLGLGLAIVRHLVELHGGTVKADSLGIGMGTTFIVSLPMKEVSC